MNERNQELKLTLDHIAIASEDIKKSILFFRSLGLEFASESEQVPEQQVEVSFADIEGKAKLELLRPLKDGSGPIGKFLEKKGPGLHHLCFRVSDLDEIEARLKLQGISMVFPVPKRGAAGKMINFIHPKDTGGVLIELVSSKEGQQ